MRQSLSEKRPRSFRLRAAVVMSLVAHLGLVPGVVALMDAGGTGAPERPAPLAARLAPEEEPPPSPEREVLEASEEEEPVPEPVPVLPEPPPEVAAAMLPPQAPQWSITVPREALFPVSTANVRVHVPRNPDTTSPQPPQMPSGRTPPPAPVADPVAPLFPEHPPADLLAGLPGGGLAAGPLHTRLDSEAQKELRRRVYAQTYYPEEAADLELEGVVVVGFQLDPQGRPDQIRVLNSEAVHPTLREGAVAMVREGAPYPIPKVRQAFEVAAAVAYLNLPESPGEKLHNVLSSGSAALDRRVRELAAQDAAAAPEPGWHLALYRVEGEVEMAPSETFVNPTLLRFDGDQRLKRTVLDELPRLLQPPRRSGMVQLPIQFRILDP